MLTCGPGADRPAACQCTSRSRGLVRYPPVIPAVTMADRHRCSRAPSPAVGAALTARCMSATLMSWQVIAAMTGATNRSHSRRWVSACLADHGLAGRVPGGGEVPGDQVRAGPLQVRRVGHQPLGDLLQPGRQPVLGRRLALPPRAVLHPHRPPPAPLPPRRVHRDPALQLNHHTTVAAGGRAGIPAQQSAGPCRAARSRAAASGALPAPARAGCGFFVGILD